MAIIAATHSNSLLHSFYFTTKNSFFSLFLYFSRYFSSGSLSILCDGNAHKYNINIMYTHWKLITHHIEWKLQWIAYIIKKSTHVKYYRTHIDINQRYIYIYYNTLLLLKILSMILNTKIQKNNNIINLSFPKTTTNNKVDVINFFLSSFFY